MNICIGGDLDGQVVILNKMRFTYFSGCTKVWGGGEPFAAVRGVGWMCGSCSLTPSLGREWA